MAVYDPYNDTVWAWTALPSLTSRHIELLHGFDNQSRDEISIDSVLDQGNEVITPGSTTCQPFKFIFFTILVGSLCLLGIIGNTISIFVLQKDKSGGTASAATYLLQALAIADNAVLTVSFIFLSIIYGFLDFINAIDIITHLTPYIYKYITSLAHMAQTATVWMTVMLALNRYIAICRPFDAYKRSSKKVARIQVIVVYVFAILFNFPRFFQYDIIYKEGTNQTEITFSETSIGPKSTFGKVYTNGLYTALVLILPIVILIILNSKLIMELRRMGQRRNGLREQRQGEGNLTVIMIIVIVIFIACNVPERINEIGKVLFRKRPSCGALYIIDCICTALIVFNSSSNFLVYYIFRRRFRQILLEKFCLCQKHSKSDDIEYMNHNGHRNDVLHSYNGLNGSRTLTTSESIL